jgi:hypothetical protein
VTKLHAAPVNATDLRGGAALVVAALGAEGTTELSSVYHIDRGYDDLRGLSGSWERILNDLTNKRRRNMAKRDSQAETNRRRRKRGGLYAPVAFLLMALAIIFGLSVFFRVSEVTVTGQVVYTADEIIAASGIELGGNLFFVDDSKAAISIRDQTGLCG